MKSRAVPSSPASHHTATARRLWQVSAALTNPYEIVLRPASYADSEFVYQIKKATLREYVDQIWGWDESQQREYHKIDREKMLSSVPKMLLMDDANKCARIVLRGVARNKGIITVTPFERSGWWLYRLQPALFDLLVRTVAKGIRGLRES